jgi:hypothetical protein
MKDYLGFIYDLQTENGNVGALLIILKTNFTVTYLNSLYASYIAATFASSREVILAVSTYNSVNIIINPENTNVSTISGPQLVNDWTLSTDITLIKSVNENYLLIFSMINEIF